jgi:hypothetical protein
VGARKVYVSQQNIEEGQAGQCSGCPIALALKDQGFWDVSVGRTVAFGRFDPKPDVLEAPVHFIEYRLPRAAQRMIRRFDDDKPVKPATFILKEIP